MNMKSNAKLMMMMAMSGMFMGSLPGEYNESIPQLTKDDIERIRKQQLLKNGCKEFHYDYRISESIVKEVTIIALNKKNADKKYNKFIKLYKESI